MFLNADSYYNRRRLFTAGYHFETFCTAYPNSEKIEEAAFKSAKSYYKLSPVYSKEQTETY